MGCTTCVDRPLTVGTAEDLELRPSLREHQTPDTEVAVAAAGTALARIL